MTEFQSSWMGNYLALGHDARSLERLIRMRPSHSVIKYIIHFNAIMVNYCKK